ncbi:MAG: glycoside hydrolase family 30 beta sandwich domain-containing protein [Spirochaetales bacterium]|nr:glycoside hydrolase family 30 beta sandwich domain-containing protein [Spirochaetales bacterium]
MVEFYRDPQEEHFSRFIKPGATRIENSLLPCAVPSASDGQIGNTLECTSFKNPDGKIAPVVCNRNEEAVSYKLKCNSHQVSNTPLFCPAHAIQTILIDNETTNRIWEKGHRKIAFYSVLNSIYNKNISDREKGFRRAILELSGKPVPEEYIFRSSYNQKSAAEILFGYINKTSVEIAQEEIPV